MFGRASNHDLKSGNSLPAMETPAITPNQSSDRGVELDVLPATIEAAPATSTTQSQTPPLRLVLLWINIMMITTIYLAYHLQKIAGLLMIISAQLQDLKNTEGSGHA